MGESRYAKKPLLYIDQPSIGTPRAEMQSSYRSKRRAEQTISSSAVSNSAGKGNKGKSGKRRNIFHDQLMESSRPARSKQIPAVEAEVPEAQELKDEQENTKEIPAPAVDSAEEQREPTVDQDEDREAEVTNGLARTPFNKLDLRGRIHYFLDKPLLVPALRCEIRAAGQGHYGIVEKFVDEIVYLRKKRKKELEAISFTDIESIRLLGF